MHDMRLNQVEACVFDAYGTLLDVHSAIRDQSTRLGDKAREVSTLWRTKQLEYTWLRSLMDRYVDFRQVTGEALDFALQTHGIEDPGLHRELMGAYAALAPFVEVGAVLETLHAAGMRTAVLSNATGTMLSGALDHAGLARHLDPVLSAEQVRIYKPHPSVYGLAVQGLDLAPGRIAFVSANAWDVAGAADYGLQAVWVNRSGQAPERLPGRPCAEVATLDGLPALLGLTPPTDP